MKQNFVKTIIRIKFCGPFISCDSLCVPGTDSTSHDQQDPDLYLTYDSWYGWLASSSSSRTAAAPSCDSCGQPGRAGSSQLVLSCLSECDSPAHTIHYYTQHSNPLSSKFYHYIKPPTLFIVLMSSSRKEMIMNCRNCNKESKD